ncbi:MAG: ATP F0F1 synthase subunit B [bacterium]
MNRLLVTLLALTATPAFAEGAEPFFSLHNAEFVVTVSFLVFVGLVIYLGVPKILGRMLDDRATLIRNELDEARLLREEAKALVASYDQKMKDVRDQSDRIISTARHEAEAAAAQAKLDLQTSIARRLAAAGDQIDQAVKAAERAIRDQAITVSVAVASDVLARQMTADAAAASIDAAISEVAAKLH